MTASRSFPSAQLGHFEGEHCSCVKELFRSGIMPPEVNNTTIVLIPKIPHPVKITDFRPISLCNVIYKVVSKCMVNRLSPVLDDIISPTQSAFIPRR